MGDAKATSVTLPVSHLMAAYGRAVCVDSTALYQNTSAALLMNEVTDVSSWKSVEVVITATMHCSTQSNRVSAAALLMNSQSSSLL